MIVVNFRGNQRLARLVMPCAGSALPGNRLNTHPNRCFTGLLLLHRYATIEVRLTRLFIMNMTDDEYAVCVLADRHRVGVETGGALR